MNKSIQKKKAVVITELKIVFGGGIITGSSREL